MRQADLRTLATRGIEVLSSLKIRGLRVHEAIDANGSRLLIFTGGIFGPSWVSVGFLLEQSGIPHTPLTLGRTYFLANDSTELRKLFGEIFGLWTRSLREEVFIPDLGFRASELKKRFDPRVLVAPALILGLTLAVSFFPVFEPEAKLPVVDSTPLATCALDLEKGQFRLWLRDQIAAADLSSGEIVIQTSLGKVSLQISQALGSTQLIYGSLNCEDGRTQKLQFRTDSQSGGDLVELGERLDP